MGLEFIRELADSSVQQVRDWDQPTLGAVMEETQVLQKRWNREGLSGEEQLERILEQGPKPRGMGVIPVDPKWELDWDSLHC